MVLINLFIFHFLFFSDPALRAFYAERRGLKVNLISNLREPLPSDRAISIIDRDARVYGLGRDYQYRSPLSGNTVRFKTPTHEAQRLDRRARQFAKNRFLMLTLRMAIFIKKGGKLNR